MKKTRRYTVPNRLSDVIRLISVLAQHEYDFKTEKGLSDALRGIPLSVPTDTWKEVIQLHPEFFRTNGDTHYALVIRSYLPANIPNNQGSMMLRPPLSISETQKMIDSAITLYDKEVEQFKPSGLWFPIIVAFITLSGTFYTGYITKNIATETNNQILTLTDSLNKINGKLKVLAYPHK